ncbi:VRR-NUC domain-containing protein [Halopseudomonas sp.]|uniref:VRR-NUC domain-containing protein n=1 Tax=Halopseudomonas sp. TaxID=2901191 RepID=UPI00311F8C18
MPELLATDFYYLRNFEFVLEWVGARYDDLLSAQEREFLQTFNTLPHPSRALLVRLIMRKGDHFRASRLRYAEIGELQQAAQPLLDQSWLVTDAPLDINALARLLLKAELASLELGIEQAAKLGKQALIEQLLGDDHTPRPWHEWPGIPDDTLFSVRISPLCERLRLLFFGNLSQDWSEFVLAELGIQQYEQVTFSAASRSFHQQSDVDDYIRLGRCRELLEAGIDPVEVIDQLADFTTANPWIERRHQRLRFQLGQQLERNQQLDTALALYLQCQHSEARQRAIRLHERLEQNEQAYALACTAYRAPHSAAEQQLVERALRRLGRKLKQPVPPTAPEPETTTTNLVLPGPDPQGVEQAVATYLTKPDAPVFYVENGLISSLFGLLCWEAVFAPLPGAFFHPFQSAPADLHDSEFANRRAALFAAAMGRLEDGSYRDCIRANWHSKYGLQSPFVFWGLLDEPLLELALHCIPATHLRLGFERMLKDIRANRAGMPDLIQFWPAEQRYCMVEVKGPGDRLQDNQRRWLAFCAEHGMPVEVVYVSWESTP